METTASPVRQSSVVRSAGIVSLAVMASRLLGLVREMLFAFFFGASRSFAIDAFFIAFRIPNLLRDLFAEGALSSAFVTVFSDYMVTKDRKEALRLSHLLATTLILILGAFVILGIIFAPQIVALIATGYQSDPEKFALTVRLTRIMMPFILLVALAAQAMGVLNSLGRFGVPAMASSFFNLGSILGGLLLSILMVDPHFSSPMQAILDNPTDAIIGMAYGVLIGGFLQFSVQWPSLHAEKFSYRPMLSWTDPGLRRILKLMGPAVIGAAAVQVNVLVNSNFASRIPGNGPVSWLSYAFRLMQFPIGVFGVAIATATLPSISRSAALKNIEQFKQTLAGSVRLAFLLTIPSAVGLAVLAQPIIGLIYQRGGFSATDTSRTAAVLSCYAIGLSGYAAIKILAPAFYALGDARTPMIISLLSILVNFVMNALLINVFHERGLALSTSAVALLNFSLLYVLMYKRVGDMEGKKTLITAAKIVVASMVMAGGCKFLSTWLGGHIGTTHFSGRAIQVFVSIGIGAAIFYATAHALKIEELSAATALIRRKLKR